MLGRTALVIVSFSNPSLAASQVQMGGSAIQAYSAATMKTAFSGVGGFFGAKGGAAVGLPDDPFTFGTSSIALGVGGGYDGAKAGDWLADVVANAVFGEPVCE